MMDGKPMRLFYMKEHVPFIEEYVKIYNSAHELDTKVPRHRMDRVVGEDILYRYYCEKVLPKILTVSKSFTNIQLAVNELWARFSEHGDPVFRPFFSMLDLKPGLFGHTSVVGQSCTAADAQAFESGIDQRKIGILRCQNV